MAVKTSKAKKQPATFIDPMSPAGVEEFRKAAEAYTKRVTRTKATAMQALVDAGLYTKSGRPTKAYR